MVKKLPPGVQDSASTPFEADTAAAPKKAKGALKVRRIGNSLGVVLPKDILAKLGVGEGDQLSVSDIPDGVALSAYSDRVTEQVEAARKAMKRYRNALRELAK